VIILTKFYENVPIGSKVYYELRKVGRNVCHDRLNWSSTSVTFVILDCSCLLLAEVEINISGWVRLYKCLCSNHSNSCLNTCIFYVYKFFGNWS